MDPTNPQVLYYGTYRLWRTTNGAANWSSVSPDLTGPPVGGNLQFRTITTIAVAPSAPATIYVGTDDARVWVTTNTGGNWTNVSAGLPQRWVTRVAVDPTNRDIGYATLSGYKEDSLQPHVFRTTNRGASWVDISGNLPDGPANDLIVDPLDTSTLYVGTDFGIFVTRDLGVRWDVLGAGFPMNPVHDLELHPLTRVLVAGTHGRSMWKLTLPTLAAAEDAAAIPAAAIALAGPNPFRDRTEVRVDLARPAGAASVRVHDVAGRLVRGLHDGPFSAGSHRLAWDGRDDAGRAVAAGTYFVRLETGGWRRSIRVTRLAG
jgi:hypothetical protein